MTKNKKEKRKSGKLSQTQDMETCFPFAEMIQSREPTG